jgi:prepilin peptidase CpaA
VTVNYALWIIGAAQCALLLSAAWTDLASRLISDRVCVALAIVGSVVQLLLAGPLQLACSTILALILFGFLLFLHGRSMLGGGDVKLLTALAIGLSPLGILGLLAVTALAGGVLAFGHLAMRRLPRPRLPRRHLAFSHRRNRYGWQLRRIYAVERWRILRHAPLPYALAIACGGIWAVLNNVIIGG